MLFWPNLGHLWHSAVTLVTFRSNHNSFSKTYKQMSTAKINIYIKNKKMPLSYFYHIRKLVIHQSPPVHSFSESNGETWVWHSSSSSRGVVVEGYFPFLIIMWQYYTTQTFAISWHKTYTLLRLLYYSFTFSFLEVY